MIGLAASLAMMSAGPGMAVAVSRDLLDDDLPPPPKEKPEPRPSYRPVQPAPKAHEHKREIARRLRQQARAAEKRKGRA